MTTRGPFCTLLFRTGRPRVLGARANVLAISPEATTSSGVMMEVMMSIRDWTVRFGMFIISESRWIYSKRDGATEFPMENTPKTTGKRDVSAKYLLCDTSWIKHDECLMEIAEMFDGRFASELQAVSVVLVQVANGKGKLTRNDDVLMRTVSSHR